MNIIKKLNDLYNRSGNNPEQCIDRKLYKLLCTRELLLFAYENILSKPDNITPSIPTETFDIISKDTLDNILVQLSNESFQFFTSKTTKIPQNSGEKGSLTIAPTRDKIVHEAIRLILNAIYEPLFHDSSHCSRPSRGTHSALNFVNLKFQHTVWMIQGDMEKSFVQIDHLRLMSIIENKIIDRKFTNLIRKSLRSGFFAHKTYQHNIIATFQDPILTPTLVNIFLHHLDTEIDKIKKSFNMRYHSITNKHFNRLRYQQSVAFIKDDPGKVYEIPKTKPTTISYLFENSSYKKLAYVRYADDWLVGVKGSKEDALEISNKIQVILQNIGINISKFTITNISKGKTLFLETNISRAKHTTMINMLTNSSFINKPGLLRMEAPLNRLAQKLTQSGFLKERKSHPKFIWMSMTHRQIILRYNAVLRLYTNYYKFTHNYNTLAARAEYWLRGSCGKLLAAKYSMKTQNKVYKKYGKDMKCPESGTKFLRPSS